MTGRNEKIDALSEDILKKQVEITEESKPIWRLVAAIEYKNGLSPAQFEEKYGISKNKACMWLDRFEEHSVKTALQDASKPGYEPKLTDEEWERFVKHLHTSPEEHGYDYQVWLPVLTRHHLRTEFDVEYGIQHVKRLLDKAGLSWRTPQPRHYEGDPGREAGFQEMVEK
jgi:transposase